MSPFGGSTAEPVCSRFDPRLFLRTSHACNPPQAAFLAACHLLNVNAIAVSTNSTVPLRELTDSLEYEVDASAMARYRRLLAEAAGVSRTGAR
ncbi:MULTISPECIES: hypothetical protein [unclassified Streptomyces]|uniref:hypothetical protein n=1 Tax=unclassified Streptomyces TaxID=2593676 RepID=UPI00278BFA2B|nr:MULTISPECIES: hypothetical protein [unclassified Streptomyces]